MPEFVTTSLHDRILAITINNPPVNALSPGVPEAIVAAVEAGAADPEVDAIVVIGGGRTFIAGFDIKEFSKIVAGERENIDLAEQILRIEDCPKPVVMALHGTALGGGLEVAMGGHYRVALANAQVGQPEVKLGLIPGAGGTQRLPRLCGIDLALELCVFGDPIPASRAHAAGIIDELIEGDLLAGALAFARKVAANPPRRARDLDCAPSSGVDEIRRRAQQKLRGQTAPLAAIEAVCAAATLPFAEGIALEKRLFAELLYGPQSKALIHVFFGERTVTKIPSIPPETKPLKIERAAVVGAGTMGAGIALIYASAGIPVLLTDASPAAVQRALEGIRKQLSRRCEPAQAEQRLALITPVEGYERFETADIITEAVFEDLDLKKKVFAELDSVARPGAILATNTSTLDIDAIAAATRRPEWVVGNHYFSPANVMKLLEIVRGAATSPEVLATSFEIGKRLKKVSVLSRNAMGFIGNRLFGPYRAAAVMCVEDGATPEQVDGALEAFGMAMGPLAVGDLAGLDVGARVRRQWKHLEQPGVRYAEAEDRLVDAGRYGQKTGAGWYRYDSGRRRHPDPEALEIARSLNLPQRTFTDEEIVQACLTALVEEGKKVLAEGVALRPVDIDIVYVYGYGFPAWRGGPMFYAGVR